MPHYYGSGSLHIVCRVVRVGDPLQESSS